MPTSSLLSGLEVSAGRPAIILAPMEGITDAPMRAMLTEIGGFSHVVSEFLRVSQTVIPKKVFRKEIPECENGFRTGKSVLVQPQLLGGDPSRLAESAREVISLGAPGIDLNFGCPAPTVNRHDGGATLLKYPERLEMIVAAVRAATPSHLPVSAKLRLGWDDPAVVIENAKRAEAGGASWITIHARTKMNGYQPPAYWEWIGKARLGVKIPVVANGDIWRIEDFRKCREISGCEHFMIGRSALADPWLAHRIRNELVDETGGTVAETLPLAVDLKAWLPHLSRFAELSRLFSQKGDDTRYAARRVKQWLRYSEVHHGTNWFTRVKRFETLPEIFASLAEI
ncbi:MAG: tRNA-dihydrouridine synthase family protein [Cryobacterium sp.]|nr:tRNA-dihydrouridine synthase family protein [Oligoflexia bacterium]